MPTNSNNFIRILVSAAVALGLLLPQLGFAHNEPLAATNTPAPTTGSGVCSKLGTATGNIDARLSDHLQRWTTNKTDVSNRIASNRIKREERLAQIRADQDAKRTAQIQKLSTRATTDEEKQAVTAFQTTLQTALLTRKTAVDAAIKTFNDGVSSAVTKRQSTIQTALTTLKTAIDAALTKAQTDCNAGVSPTTVKTNLLAAITSAKTAFQNSVKTADKVGPQLQQLIQTRNASMKKAFDAFTTTMQTARDALKAAFPEA